MYSEPSIGATLSSLTYGDITLIRNVFIATLPGIILGLVAISVALGVVRSKLNQVANLVAKIERLLNEAKSDTASRDNQHVERSQLGADNTTEHGDRKPKTGD